MGFGFRVGKGVNVYPSSRGIGVSSGAGPLRYYHRFGGTASSRRGPSLKSQLAAQERAARQQEKVARFQAAVDLEKQLVEFCQLHTEEFVEAKRWTATPPEPVNETKIRKLLVSAELEGIPFYKLGERKRAKEAAAVRLPEALEAERKKREASVDEQQAELDGVWQKLINNDPATVLGALEEAFEDNETPAVAVSCQASRVDVIMKWPSLEAIVPDTKPDLTPAGNPTVKKRPKKEQAEFYLAALASNALATVKEAFAVCPAIDEIGIAVIRETVDPSRGDPIIEPIFFGTATRSALEPVRWRSIEPIPALFRLDTGRVGLKGRGASLTLYGMAPADEDEEEFLRAIASGLGRRASDIGVKGIELPIQVSIAA